MNTSTLLDLLSHTTLKGAAVLLVALLLGLALRRTAAARRYALWITAIATLAVLPLAMWALPAWHVLPQTNAALEWPVMEPEPVPASAASVLPSADLPVTAPAASPVLPAPSQIVTPPSFSWNISWQDVVGALPLVWMLIAGLLLLRLGSSAWRLHRLEASLRPGECALLIQAAHELGLRRIPLLLIGPGDSVPMVWGVMKPRLLLPSGFETWSPEKQRGVLLHELAHLKRGDPLALWAAQWVKALHWFNPLVWLTFRQLRADQERACDDAVLRHGVRASDYAQSLLDLSRHNRLAPGLSLCALTITRCAPVEARVKAILDPTRCREGLTLRWLAGLSACALLITLPMAMLHAIEGPPLRGRILDRNGVVLAESTKEKVRVYPLKMLAAHVVGYIRLPESAEPRLHGGSGVEKKEDAALKEGKDFTLSLDARIQALTQQAMQDGGVERGAAVVLDPRTGEILASVSLPSFDPNVFIPSISYKNWDRYLKDIGVPLLNRVVKGHVPGAACLPLTALAGIAAGVGDSKFTCEGRTIYGNNTMLCWIQRQSDGKHGELDMRSAFLASCNCFWHQFGNAAGIEHIEAMSQRIGFGTRYGILDDESPGLLPSPSWLEKNHPKEKWSAGFTANTSIGQGFMLATPLQLAVLAATVGNSGKVPQPSLLKKAGATAWRADLVYEGLDVPQLETLRDAMLLVVNGDNGTGKAARSERVVIAGRTGTAQNWRIVDKKRVEDNHAWFIGFAPFDKPTLAFAILKQGGRSGGSDCAPIAKRIVEEALALPVDGSGEVKAVEEKSATAPTKFDFNAAEISRQIKLLEAELKVDLKEFKIGNGQVTIVGEASEMGEALQLRSRLAEIGDKRQVEWVFPVPRSLENGRVGFRASGVYQPSQSSTEEGSNKTKVSPKPPQIINKTTAKVISRSSSASSHSLVIDKGSLDGIVANSPVITSVGLVGKTATPDPHTTKVILLTDELCLVSAKVEGTLDQGILSGKRAAQTVQPQLHLRFLSRFAKINVGASVYSSGEGGVFPADLFLGRVKQFKSGDVSGEAIVEPAVDFSTLAQVFVMELKTEPSYQEAATPPKPANPAEDADILMDPQLAAHWKLLQRKGFLADLPAKAVIMPSKLGNVTYGSFPFQFTASREDAQHWLANSLGDVMRQHYNKYQPWPVKPGVFDFIYEGFGDCMIHIKSLEAETVEVRLWLKGQAPKSMLIAPDEAAPPTPKTAAPKELSGVVSNETQPMVDAGQKKLEFDTEKISRQIRLLANKAGVSLREFKMGEGRLSLIGLSKNLDEARMFGELLTQNGTQWGIAWHLTPPQKVPDRPLTMFMAVGVYPAASISVAMSSPPPSGITSPPNMSVSAVSGVVSPLSNWRTLQKLGKLADLPADYAPERITRAESLTGPMSSMMYAFTASRKTVHAWLSASLPSKSLAAQAIKMRELAGTEPFEHDFWGQDLCRVRVVCAENKARVLISRMTRTFNIAPDESKKPRPAGKLAPDYRQDGLTSVEPALPTLDATLRTLRSAISPEEEKQQPWLVYAAPVELNHLPSDAMKEDDALLRNSRTARNRAQQALLVPLPQMQ